MRELLEVNGTPYRFNRKTIIRNYVGGLDFKTKAL